MTQSTPPTVESHPGFTIRAAEPADLTAVRALMIRTFEEDFGYGYRPEFHADVDDLQGVYLDHPRHTLLIAVAPDGAVVGTAGVRSGGLKPAFNPPWLVARYDPERTAQLVRVYTLREWRGQGVARAMVEQTLQFVAAAGSYAVLALHTDPRSPGAERFWRSLPTTLIHDDRDGPSGSLHFEMAIPAAPGGAEPAHDQSGGDMAEYGNRNGERGEAGWTLDTRLIHAHQAPDPRTGDVVPPIHPASTFARRAIDDDARFRYARGANPTRAALETILAGLEHGAAASAFGSGMAAVTAVLQLLNGGDHAVVGYDCYLSTYHLFANDLPRYGIAADFVDLTDLDAVRRAMRPNTRLIWIETPTNPLLDIVDLAGIAAIAAEAGALTAVDNTFASPYCQNPIDFGIDLVVHSTTKYLGGHSDIVGGAVISRTTELGARITDRQYYLGAVPSPFDCWLLMRGMRTLGVRMRQQMANAQAVAEWLQRHPKVTRVLYPGLPEHPGHELARRQMPGGFSAMVSFDVGGDVAAARRVSESTRLFALATSLGGVESLIFPPTAWLYTDQALLAQIPGSPWAQNPGLIRLSIGIEGTSDLIADLDQALARR